MLLFVPYLPAPFVAPAYCACPIRTGKVGRPSSVTPLKVVVMRGLSTLVDLLQMICKIIVGATKLAVTSLMLFARFILCFFGYMLAVAFGAWFAQTYLAHWSWWAGIILMIGSLISLVVALNGVEERHNKKPWPSYMAVACFFYGCAAGVWAASLWMAMALALCGPFVVVILLFLWFGLSWKD